MEVVFNEIRISGCDQWQLLRAGIGHVGRGVEPIFEEEEQAEREAGDLALTEKGSRKQQRNEPLQQRASPEAKRRAEPSEEVMAALVNDQIGAVDKQKSAMRVERVRHEQDVKNTPGHNCRSGDRLPGFIENRLEIFEHAAGNDRKLNEAGRADYQRVYENVAWIPPYPSDGPATLATSRRIYFLARVVHPFTPA